MGGVARRGVLGGAVISVVAGLAACGDSGARRSAIGEALGRWLGGEASVASVGPVQGSRYEVEGIAWKGPFPGRAKAADVLQGPGGGAGLVTLRDAEVGEGLRAVRLGIEPGPAGVEAYRLDGGRLDAWGVSLTFAEAVVRPRGGDAAQVRLRDARLSMGTAGGVAGAVLGRTTGDGPFAAEMSLVRKGDVVEVEGRVIPEGKAGSRGEPTLFHLRLSVPGAGLAPVALDRVGLAGAGASFSQVGTPAEPPADGAALARSISGGEAGSVELRPPAAVPLGGVESALPALLAARAVSLSTSPRPPPPVEGVTPR